MTDTPNLNLPYIMAAQAQKHVTHNEAIRALDVLTQISVNSKILSTPPSNPGNGECYIVGVSATDEWAGNENQLACFQDNGWVFIPPKDGFIAWLKDDAKAVVWQVDDWIDLSPEQVFSQVPQLGINTADDSYNRLAIKSQASLFDHDGADHRLVINKASTGDTGTMIFQNNYSGRAEMGIAGSDEFSFKVSPDGTNWHSAIKINQTDGATHIENFPQQPMFNMLGDSGRFQGSPTPGGVGGGSYTAPSYLQAYNGSTLSAGPSFHHNNSTFGGTAAALDPIIVDLVEKLHPGSISFKRYGVEYSTVKIDAGTGTSGASTFASVTRYPCIFNRVNSIPLRITFNCWVKVVSGSVVIPDETGSLTAAVDGTILTSDHLITASDGWKQITRQIDREQTGSYNYNYSIMRLYAEAGSEVYMALPFLYPALLPIIPGQNYGLISAMNVWS